jgi:F0F1-type ATP synthase assembly protein I
VNFVAAGLLLEEPTPGCAGTAALVGYIADFIYRHFAGNLGAPLGLMTIGVVLLGLGAAAVRINAQYIARNPC